MNIYYCSTWLIACESVYTISDDPDYKPGLINYVSWLPQDIELYRQEFPREIRERNGLVPTYETKQRPAKRLHVPSYRDTLAIVSNLRKTDPHFEPQVMETLKVFAISFENQELERPLNEREKKVYKLVKSASSVMHTPKTFTDAFIVTFELDNPIFLRPYQLFIQALHAHDYDGVYDVADIWYNSYHPIAPVIIFGEGSLEVVETREIAPISQSFPISGHSPNTSQDFPRL